MPRTPQPGPGRPAGVVNTVHHDGRTYEQRLIDCRKSNCRRCTTTTGRRPSHGPYWYLCTPTPRGWRRLYLGKSLNTNLYVNPNGSIDWQAYTLDRAHKRTPQTGANHHPTNHTESLEPSTSTLQPANTLSGNVPPPDEPPSAPLSQGGHLMTTATPSHCNREPASHRPPTPLPPNPPGSAPDTHDQLDFFAVDPDDPCSEYLPLPAPHPPSAEPPDPITD